MKLVWLFVIIALIFAPAGILDSSALQQVAGKILVEIKPGETKTFQWGLASDSDDVITLELRAEGEGAEFLSFEKNLTLEPKKLAYATFTVTIPPDHLGGIELSPSIYATEFGEKGGATVINIEMKKIPSIVIAQNENPEFRTTQASDAVPTEEQKQSTKQETKEQEPTESKDSGCLIATAAYGSEMAPQVQLLREIRDNALLKTSSGTSFMAGFNSIYYSFSPTVAAWERQNPVFKEAVKITITPLISTLSILTLVDIDSEVEMIGYGIGVILLNVGIYFVAPASAIIRLKHKYVRAVTKRGIKDPAEINIETHSFL